MRLLGGFLIIFSISLFPALPGGDGMACAQELSEKALLRKARSSTKKGEYQIARGHYLELVKRNPNNAVYNYELGVNYYYFTSDNKTDALPYLEKAIQGSKPGDTLPELFYLLGETYHLSGEFDKAISHYQRFKPYIKSNSEGDELQNEVNHKIAAILHGKSFALVKNDSIIIENLGPNINTTAPEYVPVVNRDESLIMFTARRKENVGNKKDFRDEQYYEDMYIARGVHGNFEKAETFKISDKYVGLVENTPRHDAIVGISPDSSVLITYRDNSLWQSVATSDGTWTGPVELNENVNAGNSYTPHGALSPDGKELVFSSERKKGVGRLDLYRSFKNADGSWSEAVNLGPVVNSILDEDAPFFSPDGNTLYFSSRGHNTMGGYDVFYSIRQGEGWSEPINLGAPLNSPADDIYYLKINDFTAYFSSNRYDGLGDMDIYRILYKPRFGFNDCQLITQKTFTSPSGISFSLESIAAGSSPVTLNPEISIPGTHHLHAIYWKQGSGKVSEGNTFTFDPSVPGPDSIYVELIATNDVGKGERHCLYFLTELSDLDSVLADSLPTITDTIQDVSPVLPGYEPVTVYFELNKSGLQPQTSKKLDEQIELLKANREVRVRVHGHADSRGTDAYNKALSERRAKAVHTYLIRNGVPAAQIAGTNGMGETQLLNNCSDGVECNEEEHAINRRVTIERVR